MDWRSLWAVIVTFNKDLLGIVAPTSAFMALFLIVFLFRERRVLEKVTIFLIIFLVLGALLLSVAGGLLGIRVGSAELVSLP